ncbi:MAG: response regulator [Sphingobacteriales bacterium JAD_PAG50586_3]|nr:MAG: response regulator [Sphingobacteriales bacterium JAD_PAG50586_3]
MSSADILIIDDEAQIRRLLQITLQAEGYAVKEASTAAEGITMAASHRPQLVILDIGLPDESGHEVLKKLREWYDNPIIILSAQSDEEDIVKALDNGANDYLIKPFRTGELVARIRTALRNTNKDKADPVITNDIVTIDLAAHTVKKNDELLKLTSTEYTLLALMAKNEGKVLTHQYLLKQVWGPTYIEQSQYLRVFVAQLRKKLEDNPNKPAYIVTESGIGYRFSLQK